MPLHAETERLKIETLRARHAPFLFPVIADPRLYKYVPERPPQSVAALVRRYKELNRGAPVGSSETWLNWVVRLRSEPVWLGTLQATVVPKRTAYIGYVVSATHWSRGFATEGCTWLVRYLFNELGAAEVRASVDTRNEASWRLLERLGFVREGEHPLQLHGRPAVDYHYRLSRRRAP